MNKHQSIACIILFFGGFLLGIIYERMHQDVDAKMENSAAKKQINRLESSANDSSKSVRGNVIIQESDKRTEKIKSYFNNEQKSIKNIRDSIAIVNEFKRILARHKNW